MVAVEGIDGAGKRTFAERLRVRCEEAGLTTTIFSYPRYKTPPFGVAISEMLADGTILRSLAASVSGSATLFALDRAHSLPDLAAAMKTFDAVIVDRYIASNAAYGAARIDNERAREEYIENIAELETRFLGIPVPDIQILVQVEPEVAWYRARARARADESRTIDSFERNEELQRSAAELYEGFASRNWLSEWRMLDVSNFDEVATYIIQSGSLASAS